MDPLSTFLRGDVRWDRPEALWLLALPVLLLIARERQAAGHPLRVSFLGWVLRAATLFAFTVALAGPRQERRVPDRAVVIAIDASASLGQERVDVARDAVARVASARGEVPVRWVIAGASVVRTDDAERAREAVSQLAEPDQGTDLGTLLQEAMAALPSARRRDVLLLTDGTGDGPGLDLALRVAAARDLPISTLALPEAAPVLRLASVDADQGVLVGQPVEVRALVSGPWTGPATVTLREGADLRLIGPVTLDGGTVPFRVQTKDLSAGLHDLVLRVVLDGEPTVVAEAPLRVEVRPPPRALVVGAPGAARALREALARVQPPLQITEVPDVPAPPYGEMQLIALLDPALPAVGAPRGKALAAWVREGGRLVVTGGERGLVTDEPGAQDLAEVLPVRFPKTKKQQRAPVAVVFALDRSDSMAGGPKFEMAATALVDAVANLPPESQVGVIAFSDFPSWVWPLQPFLAPGPILTALRQVSVAGGTSIFPALEAAKEPLARSDALIKHIVLLSDGQSTTKFQRSGDVVTHLALEKVTVTTVTVTDASDRGEMEAIARAGGGRAWHAERFEDLPRLMLDELMTVHRTNKVEKEIRLLPVRGARLLAKLGELPELPSILGYVKGEQRGGSELAVATDDGHPVLVGGWYGRGRVALFASDVGGPWTKAWAPWPGQGKLWEGVLDVLFRPDPSEELKGEVLVEGGRARVVLDVRDRLGAPRGGLLVAARTEGPAGESVVPMPPIGPGRYGAWIDLAPGGATLVTMAAHGVEPDAPKQRPPGGEVRRTVALEGPRELVAGRDRPAVRRRITTETGGRENLDVAAFFAEPATERVEWTERWMHPAMAGILLLALDVLLRRVVGRRG